MLEKVKNIWNSNYIIFSNESNYGVLGFSINVSGYDLVYFHMGFSPGKKMMKIRVLGRWIMCKVGKD